jgi:type II secretory pathway pseudopilin PulG
MCMSIHARIRRRRTHRAFTLIELLITIGVIIILTAMTVSATVALVRRAEIDRTRTVLRLLDMALAEWQAQAGRTLSWGANPLPPNRPGSTLI